MRRYRCTNYVFFVINLPLVAGEALCDSDELAKRFMSSHERERARQGEKESLQINFRESTYKFDWARMKKFVVSFVTSL